MFDQNAQSFIKDYEELLMLLDCINRKLLYSVVYKYSCSDLILIMLFRIRTVTCTGYKRWGQIQDFLRLHVRSGPSCGVPQATPVFYTGEGIALG